MDFAYLLFWELGFDNSLFPFLPVDSQLLFVSFHCFLVFSSVFCFSSFGPLLPSACIRSIFKVMGCKERGLRA